MMTKTYKIKTRNKSPFKAYDLDAQKRGWLNTNRQVQFGTRSLTRQLMAQKNLEGALWVMETSNQMRTFAYSSSPQSNGDNVWHAISWTDVEMWSNQQYAPTGNISALFVDTTNCRQRFVEIDFIVNRVNDLKKVANPVQFIDVNGHQWLSNWSCQKWHKRGHKDFVFDAVYLFWQPHSHCVDTFSPLT